MPDLDLIKQAKQGMRAFGKAGPVTFLAVDEDCSQYAWFAADLLQKQQTGSVALQLMVVASRNRARKVP
jgi:hypothetical protein